MSGKRSWEDWAKDSAKKGRCPGAFPSFGLPTDQVTEADYQQSVAGLPTHPRGCKCWPEETQAVPRTVEEAASAAAKKKIDSMKDELSALVDQIAVGNVHIEGKRVVYTVKVADRLFELVDLLRSAKE